jgi:hypothetical protein
MRAHLIGTIDRGVATISHLLNVTRAHTFIGAAAGFRRAMSIAKSFAKARTTLDQPLWLLPLHMRTFAEVELKLRASLHLAFFTTTLISPTENSFSKNLGANYSPLPQEGNEAWVVLRALTATAKAVVSKNSVVGIQELMESMGGVGSIDEPDEPEYNIARLFRDISVNTIWEGMMNVMSSELIRHILNKDNLEVFNSWLGRAIATVQDGIFRHNLQRPWRSLYQRLGRSKLCVHAALGNGRRIMFSLEWVISGLLLALDSQRDQDDLGKELARR